jgi:Na+/H+ antiporter NhaC
MAWLEETLGSWGSTVLTGIVVTVAAPILLPVVGAILRPVVKEVMKVGLAVADLLQETFAEGSEHLGDLIAEAKAEYAASTRRESV